MAVRVGLGGFALLFLVFVSLFGLLLAVALVINPPEAQDDYALRKPLAGSALTVVCVLGILAVLYPDSCARIIGLKNQGKAVHSHSKSGAGVLRGHHATCASYSTHVMPVGRRAFCATCSGLLIGAIIALFGISLLFFGNLRLAENPVMPVSVGVTCVLIGLLYPFVAPRFQSGFTRFLAGILLPTGSFLILASVEEAAASIFVDLFFVASSVLWLATKISLSQWEHRKICGRCSLTSCDAELSD